MSITAYGPWTGSNEKPDRIERETDRTGLNDRSSVYTLPQVRYLVWSVRSGLTYNRPIMSFRTETTEGPDRTHSVQFSVRDFGIGRPRSGPVLVGPVQFLDHDQPYFRVLYIKV